jgi:hypothetical protein
LSKAGHASHADALDGLAAVPGLPLRAIIDSGDFEAYWAFHIRREHDRVHQARCQDGYDLIA